MDLKIPDKSLSIIAEKMSKGESIFRGEGITVRRGEAEEGRGLQLRRREVKERGAVREENNRK